MKVLVTGSAGHLGEALVRTLRDAQHTVVGLDILVAIDDACRLNHRSRVGQAVHEWRASGLSCGHAAQAARRHPSRQDFVDINISGTLNLLEESVAAGVQAFVFTSTNSVRPRRSCRRPDAPAAWITEEVAPVPKNIYGVTKAAAENLCQIVSSRIKGRLRRAQDVAVLPRGG